MIKNISVFLSAFLATLMDSGDIYIVALATPIIMTSTGASILSASWVATGYIVALTVFAPLSGWLSALLTRRIFFLLSILTFVLFSVGCSLSTSIGVLIFFRILQGVSGAGIHPISQSLVIDLFPAKKRALGSVLYGFSPLMAPVIGPIVAGYILSVSTWNSLFLINLPVGISILFLAFFSVDLNTVSNNKKAKKIDILGLFFVIAGLSSLLVGITNGRNWGWYSPQILLLILIGLLLVLFFVFGELKSDNPVIDFKKLKSKPILICSILMFNIGFLFISLAFILPIFLSVAVGLPSSSLSQVYFLSAAVLTVVLFFTGTILKNVDPRIFIMFGSICNLYAFYYFSFFDTKTTLWSASIGMCFPMVGFAVIILGITNIISKVAKQSEIENLLSIMGFIRKFAGALGIALISTVIDNAQSVIRNGVLSGYMDPFRFSFESTVGSLKYLLQHALPGNLGYGSAESASLSILDGLLQQEALALAFRNVMNIWMLIAAIFLLPAVFLFFNPKNTT